MHQHRPYGGPVAHTDGLDPEALHDQASPKPDQDVVFLGDSLTAQGAWDSWFPRWPVFNHGLNGDQTPALIQRIEQLLPRAPAVVVLMIGVNDLSSTGEDQVLERQRDLMRTLGQHCAGSQILWQSLLPVNNRAWTVGVENGSIRRFNQGLCALTREHGAQFVELHRHFCDTEGQLNARFSLDGLHLNASGYALWRNILEPFLEHAVQKASGQSSSA
jgi:lysophospholipase L1-like esterase